MLKTRLGQCVLTGVSQNSASHEGPEFPLREPQPRYHFPSQKSKIFAFHRLLNIGEALVIPVHLIFCQGVEDLMGLW